MRTRLLCLFAILAVGCGGESPQVEQGIGVAEADTASPSQSETATEIDTAVVIDTFPDSGSESGSSDTGSDTGTIDDTGYDSGVVSDDVGTDTTSDTGVIVEDTSPTIVDSGTDTYVPDTFIPDTFIEDTYVPDVFAVDTYIEDTYIPDTYVADTYVPDTTPADSGSMDSGTDAACTAKYMRMTGAVSCGSVTTSETFTKLSVSFAIRFPTAAAIAADNYLNIGNNNWYCKLNRNVVLFEIFGGTTTRKISASYTFVPDTWYNIECNYDGATKKILVNGAMIGEQPDTIGVKNASTVNFFPISSGRDMILSNIRINSQAGNVLHYPLNEGSGWTFLEASGKQSIVCEDAGVGSVSWPDVACL